VRGSRSLTTQTVLNHPTPRPGDSRRHRWSVPPAASQGPGGCKAGGGWPCWQGCGPRGGAAGSSGRRRAAPTRSSGCTPGDTPHPGAGYPFLTPIPHNIPTCGWQKPWPLIFMPAAASLMTPAWAGRASGSPDVRAVDGVHGAEDRVPGSRPGCWHRPSRTVVAGVLYGSSRTPLERTGRVSLVAWLAARSRTPSWWCRCGPVLMVERPGVGVPGGRPSDGRGGFL
jgi:hypothetical protein